MTETTAPIVVVPAPPCRARTTFPWQGRLRASAAFPGGSYAAGTLAAVTGAAEGGGFTIRVGRVRDPVGEAPVIGSVTPDQVDEVLGAVIEASLLGKRNITWDNNGLWKERCYVVTEDFLLTEEVEDGPPKHVMFYQGERVAAMPGGAGYYIAKNEVTSEVAAGRLRLDTSIPSPVSNVALLCYEFGMYAAALAGLCPDFVSRAKATGGAADIGAYWAVDVAGGTLSEPTVGREAMAGLALQRGDFVLFYEDDEAVDSSVHTAFATGDGQGVYSLWDKQDPNVVQTSVQALLDLRRSDADTPMRSVRTATPRWHRSPG